MKSSFNKTNKKYLRVLDQDNYPDAIKLQRNINTTLTWVRIPLFCYPKFLCTLQLTSPLPLDT